MFIKIDYRESSLITKCTELLSSNDKYKNIKLSTPNLTLGDIEIGLSESTPVIIIERKSVSDLLASIKDGRYKEQSFRLSGSSIPNHNILYLIEGTINYRQFGIKSEIQTAYSALTSINYYEGFSIMRSMSLDETAIIICNMAHKVERSPHKNSYYRVGVDNIGGVTGNNNGDQTNNEQTNNSAPVPYCSVVKSTKKCNITSSNIGEIMLCQLPGIGSNVAVNIMERYKTIPALINAVSTDNNCLNDICTIDKNGKRRKISKTVISKIIEFCTNFGEVEEIEEVEEVEEVEKPDKESEKNENNMETETQIHRIY